MSQFFVTSANQHQRQAIETTDGPLLIIAGPGSGKTFTLVERVVFLITQKHVAPENLLVVTFTDKAAQELTTRISNRLTELDIRFNLNEMYLGTFHSICLRWLEENRDFARLKRNFTMMDQFDQRYFLFQRIREYEEVPGIQQIWGDGDHSAWRRSEPLMQRINMVSEEALDIGVLCAAPHEAVRALGEAAALYQRQLEEANALDFSTIQFEALRLLRTQPAVRHALRAKIAFMMVDEYQDTNTIQEQILRELAGEYPNLCVVGDDDQGLYRFRGATIRNILQFRETFADGECGQVKLTVNYRSHPSIVDFYNTWIKGLDWSQDGQSFRYGKTIVPDPAGDFPDTATSVRIGAPNEESWRQEILAFLHTLRDKGHLKDWNQVAFLFRSVRHERVIGLAQFLEEHGIGVYSPRAKQFFDREEIRLMIGALIAVFPQFPEVRKWKADAELDVWDYYDSDYFAPFAQALRHPEHADLKKWVQQHARAHMPLTSNMDYAFSGLFYDLLRFPLFSRYLDEDRMVNGVQDGRPMRNLAVFSQLLNKFEYLHHINVLTPEYLDKNLRDLFNQFLRFLIAGGIDEYEDEAEYAPSGCVSILTIHQSKGLEYPVVIVGSMEAVPRKQYDELDEILASGYLSRPIFEPLDATKFFDFWRLYYTAFSRAQNILALTAAEVRKGGHRCPSKYLLDYYDGLPSWRSPEFRPGDIPLKPIKEAKLKRQYSFTSHILLYENCGEQYRFFKELEFAPVRAAPRLFGVLVHETIEDIHKAVLRGEEHRLSEQQVTSWFETNYAYLTKRERVYLTRPQQAIALNDVLRYFRRQNGDWSHIREAEVDVSLVKDEYILAGKVDLIRGEDNSVEIVDFKSERKPDVNNFDDRERIDRYRRQLEIYAYIVEQRTGLPVSRSHIYYTREEDGLPTITFSKDHRSIDRTIAAVDAVVHRIEGRDYRIAERPARLCKECDMRAYCDARNWTFLRGTGA